MYNPKQVILVKKTSCDLIAQCQKQQEREQCSSTDELAGKVLSDNSSHLRQISRILNNRSVSGTNTKFLYILIKIFNW